MYARPVNYAQLAIQNGGDQDRWVAAVVDHYLDTRRIADNPISTRQAFVTLRAAMTRYGLSDRELVEIVTRLAVKRGRCVEFDNDELRSDGRAAVDLERPAH